MTLPVRHTNSAPERATLAERWDPFEELDRFRRQFDEMFDAFRRWPAALGDVFTPLADVEETDDAYLVEIELPGVRADDVDIHLAGRRLTVSGERKEKERVGVLRRRERVVGRFRYEVTLPGAILEDRVEANMDDGVLTVRIPKPDSERPRRIEISRG